MKALSLYFPSLQKGFVAVTLMGALCQNSLAQSATANRAVAVTVHPIATTAAQAAFRRGGNAIDAAVAAALTLGVVDGYNSGLGGGCFMLVRLANGRMIAIDGRETAPLAATRDLYVRNGIANTQFSQSGPLAVATPGALAAYNLALTDFGGLKLRDLLIEAARIAEQGFSVDAGYAQRVESAAAELNAFESSRAVFLHGNGTSLRAGEILKQPDLAATYRGIATHGPLYFYNGPFSLAVGNWMSLNGGILTALDFGAYKLRVRQSLNTTYRGHTILGFPPPSSGGVHVAEILNILENFDLKKMGTNSTDLVHVVAEAMKLAFADRAHWLGDPDFVRVPAGLISKPYAAVLAKKIRMDRAMPAPEFGTPAGAQQETFERHTTHFSTADAAGNWVACTATINTTFGSKVVVPGTGVVLNNEMDDFSIRPGVPNYFGLVGSEANSIAPGKRPLSSMSPTIVLKNGKPIMAVGAAGGPTIISQVVLAVIYTVDFGLDLEAALAQPRFHHQWSPNELKIETKFGDEVLRELERRGHKLNPVQSFGAMQAVGLSGSTNAITFIGVPDPRGAGRAGGL